MSEMTWQWIAGFFEGEGTIFWQERRAGTKQGLCGRLSIGQKCKEPLQAIFEFLLDNGFHEPRLYLRPASPPRPQTMAIWILTIQWREDVIRMLREMEPMLYQKRDRARLVMQRLEALDAERTTALARASAMKRDDGASWREVARSTGIGRVALSNYARSAGISLRDQSSQRDAVSWRDDRIQRGLCETCGAERGSDGTKRKCQACANKYNTWRNEHRRIYGRGKRVKA